MSLTVRRPASVRRRLRSCATTSCSRCPGTGSAGSATRTRTGSTASLDDVVAGPPRTAAFAEYGRLAKTLHRPAVADPVDDTYRRRMNRQLTVQESRHRLARDVCHGKRGTIHQAYREGTEDQFGALGLVLNAIVLWTTR